MRKLFYIFLLFICSESAFSHYIVTDPDYNYTLINDRGYKVLKGKYKRIYKLPGDYYVLYSKNKSYLYCLSSKSIVYKGNNDIHSLLMPNNLIIIQKNDSLLSFYDDKFKFKFNVKANEVDAFTNKYIKIKKSKKQGVIDIHGRVILPAIYDDVFNFSNECLHGRFTLSAGSNPLQYRNLKYQDKQPWAFHLNYFVVTLGKKQGIYDANGIEILPIIYDYIWDYSPEFLIFQKNNKWGLFNTITKQSITSSANAIGDFNKELAKRIKYNFGYQFLPRFEIERTKYHYSKGYSEGLIRVKIGKWGFIDINGKTVIPTVYNEAKNFSAGLAAVRRGQKWGFIDTKGTTVIPFKYKDVTSFTGNVAFCKTGKKWRILNKLGQIQMGAEFDNVEDFLCNRAIVYKNNKCGFVAPNGYVSPILYDSICPFAGKITAAGIGHKWGVIDTSGNLVVDFVNFRQDYSVIKANGRKFIALRPFIGDSFYVEFTDGKPLTLYNYPISIGIINDHIEFYINHKCGIMDTVGNILIPALYDRIEFCYDSLIEASIDFKQGHDYYSKDYKRIIIKDKDEFQELRDGKSLVTGYGAWALAEYSLRYNIYDFNGNIKLASYVILGLYSMLLIFAILLFLRKTRRTKIYSAVSFIIFILGIIDWIRCFMK